MGLLRLVHAHVLFCQKRVLKSEYTLSKVTLCEVKTLRRIIRHDKNEDTIVKTSGHLLPHSVRYL